MSTVNNNLLRALCSADDSFDFKNENASPDGLHEVTKTGHALSSQTRAVICNVYLSCAKDLSLSKEKVLEKVAKLTNVSLTTTRKIINEGPISPKKTGRKPRGILPALDSFDEDVIRRTIYNFYAENKLPTIEMLMEAVKNLDTGCESKQFSKETLRRFIKYRLQMRFRKFEKKNVIMESPRIRAWRCKYLHKINAARREGKMIIYLDETWFDTYDRTRKCWTDGSERTCQRITHARGKRLLILHAGSENGWVSPSCFFLSGKNLKDASADYHADMNSAVFEDWLQNQLLPSLPEPAVIVMDNASYHSRQETKQPTSGTRKNDIVEFLKNQKVSLPEILPTKPVLLEMVKKLNLPKAFWVDNAVMEAGHEILRLPPYHCIFNPIEMVWAEIKQYVRRNNCTPNNDASVIDLLRKAADEVTPQKWRKYVEHVKKEEKKFYFFDSSLDEAEENGKFIINLEEQSSSSSESD